jgi:hypothetical protein
VVSFLPVGATRSRLLLDAVILPVKAAGITVPVEFFVELARSLLIEAFENYFG